MSCLLRHPARVPALFSGAAEPEPRRRAVPLWRRLAPAGAAHPAPAWAALMLIEIPLVKAGAAIAGLALRG